MAPMLGVEDMATHAERMRWRAGVDPETRERREALALQAVPAPARR
jgi:hypothetical protein